MESYFGLQQRPFPSTLRPSQCFPARSQEEAFAMLRCCLTEQEPLGAVFGMPGLGKTLLLHRLLAAMPARRLAVVLTIAPGMDVADLYQALLFEWHLAYEGLREQELRLRAVQAVIDRFLGGHQTVVLIDEAHHLQAEQLEEIRLLTNLEGQGRKAVQVLLFAQPSLKQLLWRPECQAFRERLAMTADLHSLPPEEIVEYVRHHIERAGGMVESIFSPDTLSELSLVVQGNPRRIHQLCHRALLLAYTEESGTVQVRHLRQAMTMVQLASHTLSTHWEGAEVHHSAFDVTSSAERPMPSKVHLTEPSWRQESAHVIEVGAIWDREPAVATGHADQKLAESRATESLPSQRMPQDKFHRSNGS